MTTDLFGKPIGRQHEFTLNLQQRRQATLLYHWMSLDYLHGLKHRIDALIKGADANLDTAQRQGRDALLTNPRWGVRDTAANWSTNAYSALEDFRKSTIQLIAWRAIESYCGTGAYQCGRMLGEFSSMWMTPEEEQRFNDQWKVVYRYAQFIDFSAGVGGRRNQLNDSSMTAYWLQFKDLFSRLPKYRVRTDVQGVSGKRPPRTGVYVAQDDSFAALQFAWTGNDSGALGDAETLNDVGKRVVASISRDALWIDRDQMTAYVGAAFKRGELHDRWGFDVGDEDDPRWAPSILSAQSFTTRECKWYFVERIEDEFEDEDETTTPQPAQAIVLRVEAGASCPLEGFWFTPAAANSRRRFKAGEVMPDVGGDYGKTIWHWDAVQT